MTSPSRRTLIWLTKLYGRPRVERWLRTTDYGIARDRARAARQSQAYRRQRSEMGLVVQEHKYRSRKEMERVRECVRRMLRQRPRTMHEIAEALLMEESEARNAMRAMADEIVVDPNGPRQSGGHRQYLYSLKETPEAGRVR